MPPYGLKLSEINTTKHLKKVLSDFGITYQQGEFREDYLEFKLHFAGDIYIKASCLEHPSSGGRGFLLFFDEVPVVGTHVEVEFIETILYTFL